MSYDIFQSGRFYHIFSRTIGSELLFRDEGNFRFFLERFHHFCKNNLEVYSYCLLSNHLHFLVKVKEESSHEADLKGLSDFLNSYTKAFNKLNQRNGGLFLRKFKRKLIHDDSYLTQVIIYIHRNLAKHGITPDFDHWKHSSYPAFFSVKPTNLMRNYVLDWFGGIEQFQKMHQLDKLYELPEVLCLE